MVAATAANPPPPQAVPVMKGGAREQMLDLILKFSKPIQIYILLFLILTTIFVKLIPAPIPHQADTLLGRTFLFFATLVLADFYAWSNGLLMAVLALLLLSLSPRVATTEGFQSKDETIKLVDGKRKWWVEQILKENPVAIEEETVRTQAIQDNTSSQTNSSTQK